MVTQVDNLQAAHKEIRSSLKRDFCAKKNRLRWGLFFVFLGIALVTLLFKPVATYFIRTHLLPKIERNYHIEVHPERVAVHFSGITLSGVRIQVPALSPLFREPFYVQEVAVSWNLREIFRGRLTLEMLKFSQAVVQIREPNQTPEQIMSSIQALLPKAGLSANPHPGSAFLHGPLSICINKVTLILKTQAGSMMVDSLNLLWAQGTGGSLSLEHGNVYLSRGMTASFRSLSIPLPASFRQISQHVTIIHVEEGAFSPWEHLKLTGIRGYLSWHPAQPRKLNLHFHGGYEGSASDLWEAQGSIDKMLSEADLFVKAKQLKAEALGSLLHKLPFEVNREAQLGAQLYLHSQPQLTSFQGVLKLERLSIFHPLLAAQALYPVELEFVGQGYLREHQRFVLEPSVLRSQGLEIHLSLNAELQPPAPTGTIKSIKARSWREQIRQLVLQVKIPKTPCQSVLAAFPQALLPKLAGFQLGGSFSTNLAFQINFAKILNLPPIQEAREPQLPAPVSPTRIESFGKSQPSQSEPVAISGTVGIDGCHVLQSPQDLSAQRLTQSFTHQAEKKPGRAEPIWVGKENPDFVPISQISPHLIHSILTTEDSTFMRHKGFIHSEFRSALQKNLQSGSFRLGASSITMQMVKNLFFSKEKTLSRKLQEMFLTWYLEQDQHLPKARILEIYFNIIEFGPGIYGIKQAALHYFGKHPWDLTPREAAWFSSILPSPKRRYIHYCYGAPSQRWETYLDRILVHMYERNRLTDVEFGQAIQDHLIFSRAQFVSKAECLAQIQRFTHPAQMLLGRSDSFHQN